MDSARCGVFRDHRMACPALRNCAALLGSAEPTLTVNVCVDDMGDLDAIKWCNYGGKWCRATSFPGCDAARGWPCDDFEIVVCEDDTLTRRILRSRVDATTGRCGYELATRYEEPPSPNPSPSTRPTSLRNARVSKGLARNAAKPSSEDVPASCGSR